MLTIEPIDDLAPLARAGRRLMGTAQRINLGADVFLADPEGRRGVQRAGRGRPGAGGGQRGGWPRGGPPGGGWGRR